MQFAPSLTTPRLGYVNVCSTPKGLGEDLSMKRAIISGPEGFKRDLQHLLLLKGGALHGYRSYPVLQMGLDCSLKYHFSHWIATIEASTRLRPGKDACTQAVHSSKLHRACRQHLSLDFFDFQTYKAASLHPQLQQSLASAS